MVKLFVTGDNHIGLKYAGHEKAAQLCAARMQAFETMVQEANREQCDLFVITGDLFDNTYSIAKRDVQQLVCVLSQFGGTVAVLPGNHDYYDEDAKVWRLFREAMATTHNVMLLSEYRPYRIPVRDEQTAVLYPALCTSLHSQPMENNIGWIKNEPLLQDGSYHIGVAHGAVEGETIDREGHYFLMTRRELEEIPVDVWLIGHTHVPFPRYITQEYTVGERILNAGTHVQTDVACHTQGQCFVVEIAEDKSVRTKAFLSGTVRFRRVAVTLTADHAQSELQEALREIDDHAVVDVLLSGAISAQEYDTRAQWIDACLSRFLESTYSDASLSKQISNDLIEAEFAQTSFAADFLKALMDEPKEAQLVYEMLKTLGGKAT